MGAGGWNNANKDYVLFLSEVSRAAVAQEEGYRLRHLSSKHEAAIFYGKECLQATERKSAS